MSKMFEKKYQQLTEEGKLFSTATVVRSVKPSSSKAGDKAVVDQSGELWGWIGGGCTQSIVIYEARRAMETRKPILVRIAPDLEMGEENGIKTYKMTCQSGGTVDVFIDPQIPRPHLIITGQSAIAKALIQLTHALQYPVSVVTTAENAEDIPEGVNVVSSFEELGSTNQGYQCIIVATQGDRDEEKLISAMLLQHDYLAFVSSRKKAQAIFSNLREKGVTFDQLKQIKTPAGMDIGAQLPGEVAVSIIAEIIQRYRSGKTSINKALENASEKEEEVVKGSTLKKSTHTEITQPDMIINPVCGIPIMLKSARHIEEREGKLMYFCCEGCKKTYDKDPDFYWHKMEEMPSMK